MIPLFWTKSQEIWTWLPRLQSHRGYWSGGIRENTLAALKKSVDLGYEMIEFDVRLAATDEVVLFHDEGFDQKRIREMTLTDLRSLIDVSSFEDVLQWLKADAPAHIKLNIELKTDEASDSTLEKKVVQLLEKYQLVGRVLVSSFNPLSLARVRRLNPKIYRAQLLTKENHPKNKWYLQKRFFNFLARPHMLNLRHTDWNPAEFKFLVDHVPIVLWTFNDLDQLHSLTAQIHGIISDKITPADYKLKCSLSSSDR